MEFMSVPIIVICSYMIGEILKVMFKKHKKMYSLIPILVAMLGGLLGVLIYLTNKEMIMNASNIWIALGVGIVSGTSSTGTNQIIKKLFEKEK
ncbi:MAG: phage holin family protein [Bacilli bacterium]